MVQSLCRNLASPRGLPPARSPPRRVWSRPEPPQASRWPSLPRPRTRRATGRRISTPSRRARLRRPLPRASPPRRGELVGAAGPAPSWRWGARLGGHVGGGGPHGRRVRGRERREGRNERLRRQSQAFRSRRSGSMRFSNASIKPSASASFSARPAAFGNSLARAAAYASSRASWRASYRFFAPPPLVPARRPIWATAGILSELLSAKEGT